MAPPEISSPATFNFLVSGGKPTAAFLFWDDCGYCDDIAPFFEEQSEESKYESINFVRVDKDSDLGRQLRVEHGIRSYPRFLIFNVPNLPSSKVTAHECRISNGVVLVEKGNRREKLTGTLDECLYVRKKRRSSRSQTPAKI